MLLFTSNQWFTHILYIKHITYDKHKLNCVWCMRTNEVCSLWCMHKLSCSPYMMHIMYVFIHSVYGLILACFYGLLDLLSFGNLDFQKRNLNIFNCVLKINQKCYGFRMTWGWVNDRIFIFGWTSFRQHINPWPHFVNLFLILSWPYCTYLFPHFNLANS